MSGVGPLRDAPAQLRFSYAPVTIPPRTLFFGLVGIGAPPDDPALSKRQLRSEVFADYEVEVDGVIVRGDGITVDGPTASAGGENFTVFNLAQRLDKKGRHSVIRSE